MKTRGEKERSKDKCIRKTSRGKNGPRKVRGRLKSKIHTNSKGLDFLRLNFSLSYDSDISVLYVTLLEAMDLPIRDLTGSVFNQRLGAAWY